MLHPLTINRPLPPIPIAESHNIPTFSSNVVQNGRREQVKNFCTSSQLSKPNTCAQTNAPVKEHVFQPIFQRSRPRVPRMGTCVANINHMFVTSPRKDGVTESNMPTTPSLNTGFRYSERQSKQDELHFTASHCPSVASRSTMVSSLLSSAVKVATGRLTKEKDVENKPINLSVSKDLSNTSSVQTPRTTDCVSIPNENKSDKRNTSGWINPTFDLGDLRSPIQRKSNSQNRGRLTPILERTNDNYLDRATFQSPFCYHSDGSDTNSESSYMTETTNLSLTWPLSRSQTEVSDEVYRSHSNHFLDLSPKKDVTDINSNKLVDIQPIQAKEAMSSTEGPDLKEDNISNEMKLSETWKLWKESVNTEDVLLRLKRMHIIALSNRRWTIKRRPDGSRYLAYRRHHCHCHSGSHQKVLHSPSNPEALEDCISKKDLTDINVTDIHTQPSTQKHTSSDILKEVRTCERMRKAGKLVTRQELNVDKSRQPRTINNRHQAIIVNKVDSSLLKLQCTHPSNKDQCSSPRSIQRQGLNNVKVHLTFDQDKEFCEPGVTKQKSQNLSRSNYTNMNDQISSSFRQFSQHNRHSHRHHHHPRTRLHVSYSPFQDRLDQCIKNVDPTSDNCLKYLTTEYQSKNGTIRSNSSSNTDSTKLVTMLVV